MNCLLIFFHYLDLLSTLSDYKRESVGSIMDVEKDWAHSAHSYPNSIVPPSHYSCTFTSKRNNLIHRYIHFHQHHCNGINYTGSRPDSKTWRFFYSGDLWPEGLLASLTYINGPSGNRQIWKVLQWKSDKYSKMNIRTIQSNDPIQCKMLFYISGPDFVVISTTFMW